MRIVNIAAHPTKKHKNNSSYSTNCRTRTKTTKNNSNKQAFKNGPKNAIQPQGLGF